MTKKSTRISIETHRRLVVRTPDKRAKTWCESCSAPAEMLTPEEAAAAAEVNAQLIYPAIEMNQIHFTETRWGILICLRSLLVMVGTDGRFAIELNE